MADQDLNTIDRMVSPRMVTSGPIEYRLGIRAGAPVLQGCFRWTTGHHTGLEWHDLPTVVLDDPPSILGTP